MKKVLILGIVFLFVSILICAALYIKGTNADLSYEKANVAISSLKSGGKLDVLTASIKYYNTNIIGEADNPQYATIYTKNGTVVYSVDLSGIETYSAISDKGGKTLIVKVPPIEAKVYIDELSEKEEDYYQKHGWTGNARDGFTMRLKTDSNAYEELEKTFKQNSDLAMQARESAKKQIEMLINNYLPENEGIEILLIMNDGQEGK